MVIHTVTIIMNQIKIDLHNHILHEVDDGAKNIEVSKKMLIECKKQNINSVYLTPHINSSVTRSSRKEQIEKFELLKKICHEIKIKAYLGAEIYISYRLPEINFSNYTMGKSNILLVEFSPYNDTPIFDHVFNLQKMGYKIIIAHVERYSYLSIEDIFEIKKLGIFLQVNCDSVLNIGNKSYSKKCIALLKNDLIDFVASDAHGIKSRPINMNNAYKRITKVFSREKAEKLFFHNQEKLFKRYL